MSREQLKFIFCDLLPDMNGKTVVDIGSRMGPVLYGVRNPCQAILKLYYAPSVSAHISPIYMRCLTLFPHWFKLNQIRVNALYFGYKLD